MASPAPAPAPAPASTCTAEHAAMGHCTMPTPAPAPGPASTCTPEHAAMGHCTMPSATSDPHAGHAMGSTTPAPPVAPPPAEALSGPAHAADTVYNTPDMARSRRLLRQEHGGMAAQRFLIDRLEAGIGDGRETYSWDAHFWIGGDIDKLWLKSEGEGAFGGEFEGVETQALWSHAIDPWFDLQAGIRQDFRPGPDRTHLVLGIQGLAPYWFEVEGALFLSSEGELTAGVEAEYDLRLTQQLILQPRVELNLSAQNAPEIGLGSGLSQASGGLRLRYEIIPEFAPYVGVEYERAFGRTEDSRLAAGEDTEGWRLLLGLRTWF